MDKLTKKELDQFFEIKQKIRERMEYVIKSIVEICGYKGKRDSWWWYIDDQIFFLPSMKIHQKLRSMYNLKNYPMKTS